MKNATFFCFLVITFMLALEPGIAQGKDALNSEDKDTIRIEEAYADEETDELTVIGFGLGSAEIRLGDPTGPLLPMISQSDSMIVVELPDDLIPGNYLVNARYRVNPGKVYNAYFEMTLGAVGPQGEQGPPGPLSSGHRSVIGGGSNSLPTAPAPGFMGLFSNFLVTDTSDARRPLPGSGTVSKFRVRLENAPGGARTDEWLFTLRKDGVDTSLGCSVFETFAKCNDLVDCVNWSAGQAIDISVTTSGAPAQSSRVYWTAEYRRGVSCP